MVHNGIEYGVMAAYAEGLNIIRNANVGKAEHEADAETTPLRHPGHYQYDLNVAEVAEVRRRGSVIASWLLDLTAAATFDDPTSRSFRAGCPTPARAVGRSWRRSTRACPLRCSPRRSSHDFPPAATASTRTRPLLGSVKGAGEAGATAQPSAALPAGAIIFVGQRLGITDSRALMTRPVSLLGRSSSMRDTNLVTKSGVTPAPPASGGRPRQRRPDGSRRHAGVRRWIPSQSRGRARVAVALAVIAALATAVGCVPTTTAVPPGVGSRWATGLAGHNQVVVASGVQLNSSISTVTTWTRTATGWAKTGSWAGHNGWNGWTSNHRLGDGRTPIGVFTLTAAGGYAPNPGTRLPYEYAPAFYSRVVNGVREFNYVVAIDYNRVPRTPPSNPVRPRGRAAGGGIWFHVDTNSATAGCVTVPNPAMVQVLRWLDPAKSPVILMGPASTVAG